MSLAKTLIQKEIDRYKRRVRSLEGTISGLGKIKKDERPDNLDEMLKYQGDMLRSSRGSVTELETDLKKL